MTSSPGNSSSGERRPMRFSVPVGCCANARHGAAQTEVTRPMNSRRLIRSPRRRCGRPSILLGGLEIKPFWGHLVGAGEDCGWDRKAEVIGRFQAGCELNIVG